jgi:hypothetical protein
MIHNGSVLGAVLMEWAALQVWYSAAWSRATLTAFRVALVDVLCAPEDPATQAIPGVGEGLVGAAELPAPVVELLRHWQGCSSGDTVGVSLEASRRLWLASVRKPSTVIGNFTHKADRCGGLRATGEGRGWW